MIRRGFDLLAAGVGLVLLSPLLLLIGAAIRLDSPGPALFRQLRVGRWERPFVILKFRTMVVDGVARGGLLTVPDDPRVTRVGRWLRASKLDELPQLINVLKGDMSLVGPRPEQPEFVERFRDRYPEYNARHRVRSGLTGWAQINGLRGDSSIRQRVIHDLYYIENWSFALDLKILWRTLRVALHTGH